MVDSIIEATYDRLNSLANQVLEHLAGVKDLARICVLYVHDECKLFEDILLKRTMDRKLWDYLWKPMRIYKALYLAAERHTFVAQYWNLITATARKRYGLAVAYSRRLAFFYIFYRVEEKNDYVGAKNNGCLRRHCYLNDDGCTCGEPITGPLLPKRKRQDN